MTTTVSRSNTDYLLAAERSLNGIVVNGYHEGHKIRIQAAIDDIKSRMSAEELEAHVASKNVVLTPKQKAAKAAPAVGRFLFD
jgi:hypothetical protein